MSRTLDRKGILHPGQQDTKGNEQAVCDLSYTATLKTSDSWKQGRAVAVGVGNWQTGYGAKVFKLSTRIDSAEGANCKGGGKDWEEGIYQTYNIHL